jgi:hypothetical protein
LVALLDYLGCPATSSKLRFGSASGGTTDANVDEAVNRINETPAAEVSGQWFERRSEKDLVIKMNTGSGKTFD